MVPEMYTPGSHGNGLHVNVINNVRRYRRPGRRNRHRTTAANTATNQTTTSPTPILSETQTVPPAFNPGLSPNTQPSKTLLAGAAPAPDASPALGSTVPLGYVSAQGEAPVPVGVPAQGAAPVLVSAPLGTQSPLFY